MYAKYYNTPFDICRLSSKPGSDLKALLKQADNLLSLENRLLRALPEQFRKGWHLASYRQGALALQCDNAAIATRLRLQQAIILKAVKHEPGLEKLRRLCVTVRPRHYKRGGKRTTKPISSAARLHLLETAEGIEDIALRSAIKRLAKTAGRNEK